MINYIELGVGLHEHLASEGVYLEQSQDGKWQANASDERVNNLIASYNPWAAEKAKKLLEINSWFQSEVEKLTAGTTQVERDSWSVQVSEAYGYRPISMLAAMAHRALFVNAQKFPTVGAAVDHISPPSPSGPRPRTAAECRC